MAIFVHKTGWQYRTWTGSTLRPLVLLLALALYSHHGHAAEQQEVGVVLYDEPPATYVDLIHFTSIDRGNIAYSTVKRTNGEDVQIGLAKPQVVQQISAIIPTYPELEP